MPPRHPLFQDLPIDEALPGLIEKLRTGANAVLVAPPGAGKTTRVPPALLRELAPAGRIVMLQPRRVAARAAARRIAEENGWTLGEEVGYQVRFDRQWRADSRIVVVTEGILVQWLQADPFLEGTSILLFDEFHERSLSVDLALAMARKVQREARSESDDLRLIAMSATLSGDTRERLIGFLDGPVVESHGRLHPVDVTYDERVDDRALEVRVAAAVRRSLREPREPIGAGGGGDVLAFLPGVGEIRRTQEALGDLVGIAVLPLHGDLAANEQDAALSGDPGQRGARRVVLATNVAETSVTVEGVRTVIDSGLVRTLRYDPSTGLDSLVLGRVSRASADQRAGRAGREAPGSCIRLWTPSDDRALQPAERPEIQRVDLAGAALELLAWGERDLTTFSWFEAPQPERLATALALLEQLGAVDDQGLTTLGRAMARLPVAPRLARLVIEGGKLGALGAASEIAALLSERRPRGSAPAVRSARSDLLIERDGLHAGERSRVRAVAKRIEQAGRRATERESAARVDRGPLDEETALLRAIVAAYPDRVARKRSDDPAEERAVLVGGRGVHLGRESAVRNEPLFVAIELDDRGTEARVRTASAAEVGWLDPALLRTETRLRFDDARERVVAVQSTRYLDLFLDERERPIPAQSQGEAEALLIEAASQRLARALSLDEPHLVSLRARWNWLATAMPDLALPPCDEARIRGLLPELAMGARSFADLRRAPLADRLLQELEPKQRAALDRHAPERLPVPSGSAVRLDYESGAIPVLAVRIQEMFGVEETPRLAGGRIPVLIHLLAPNGRPQQVTQDLASFWKNTYPVVKRELAARYPRHAWPDDPAHATPQRRPARR